MFRRLYIKWLVWRGKAVDIWSKSKYPADVLSNLCSNVFRFDGMMCGSMEGFLQSLKQRDRDKQQQICSMKGRNAKNMTSTGWQTDQIVWWKGVAIDRQSDDYTQLVRRAYQAMFDQSDRFRAALMSTRGMKLFHSRGEANPYKTILTEQEFCQILTDMRDSYDKRDKGIETKECASMDVSAPQNVVSNLEKLMEKGNYAACFDLGQLYYLGNGVQRDVLRAISYFKKAAENGIAEAAYQLGRIYETGDGEELPANQTLSFEWYARAAKEGIPEAENNLGSCYFFGRGVGVDFEKAFQLYKSSAEKGNSEAEMNVGICYAAGKGIQQDYAQAYTWWKKAAERGHVKAMVNLATCYEMGVGTTQDLSEAYGWYVKAAEHGDPFAAQKLDSLK